MQVSGGRKMLGAFMTSSRCPPHFESGLIVASHVTVRHEEPFPFWRDVL